MEEVAETLRSVGVEPVMAEATARCQDWLAGLGLLEHFGGKAPDDYRAVAQAVADVARLNDRLFGASTGSVPRAVASELRQRPLATARGTDPYCH